MLVSSPDLIRCVCHTILKVICTRVGFGSGTATTSICGLLTLSGYLIQAHLAWLPFLFPPDPSAGPSATTPGESAPIRAPASLWRCSRIMHLLRDLHPTLLSALEGIVDQVREGSRMAGISLASLRNCFHFILVSGLIPIPDDLVP